MMEASIYFRHSRAGGNPVIKYSLAKRGQKPDGILNKTAGFPPARE